MLKRFFFKLEDHNTIREIASRGPELLILTPTFPMIGSRTVLHMSGLNNNILFHLWSGSQMKSKRGYERNLSNIKLS